VGLATDATPISSASSIATARGSSQLDLGAGVRLSGGTRNGKCPRRAGVATTQMIDAVASCTAKTRSIQDARGFPSTSASSSAKTKSRWAAKKAPGSTIRGHIPEKEPIGRRFFFLDSFLLMAEMIARAALPSATKFARCTRNSGANFWPVRENLHLPTNKGKRRQAGGRDASTLAGRKVISIDRRWRKICFGDGSGCSAPFRHGAAASPVRRSRKRRRFREVDARSITMGTAKLNKMRANEKKPDAPRHYGPAAPRPASADPRGARHFRHARHWPLRRISRKSKK